MKRLVLTDCLRYTDFGIVPTILYAVFSTGKKQKYSGRGWKNVSGNMGWNLRKRRHRYWNLGGLQEGTKTGTWENPQKHLTSQALPFTVGWIPGNVFFRCKVRTSKKKFRSKIRSMKRWMKVNRKRPVREIIETVNARLRGHCQYYGVTDNLWEVRKFQDIIKRPLFKRLNRRSQKKSYTADVFY